LPCAAYVRTVFFWSVPKSFISIDPCADGCFFISWLQWPQPPSFRSICINFHNFFFKISKIFWQFPVMHTWNKWNIMMLNKHSSGLDWTQKQMNTSYRKIWEVWDIKVMTSPQTACGLICLQFHQVLFRNQEVVLPCWATASNSKQCEMPICWIWKLQGPKTLSLVAS